MGARIFKFFPSVNIDFKCGGGGGGGNRILIFHILKNV